jgi:hypothetical protein
MNVLVYVTARLVELIVLTAFIAWTILTPLTLALLLERLLLLLLLLLWMFGAEADGASLWCMFCEPFDSDDEDEDEDDDDDDG